MPYYHVSILIKHGITYPLCREMKDNTVVAFKMWALFMKDTTENTLVSVVIS